MPGIHICMSARCASKSGAVHISLESEGHDCHNVAESQCKLCWRGKALRRICPLEQEEAADWLSVLDEKAHHAHGVDDQAFSVGHHVLWIVIEVPASSNKLVSLE